MFGAQKYKRTLKNTTALVAVVMLAMPTGARATDYLINSGNSPYAGPLSLGTGDNVTVTNAGSITGGNTGVQVSGAVAGSIDSSGLISGNSFGIDVQSNSDISGSITNESGGTISGGYAGICCMKLSGLTGKTKLV